MSDILVAVGSVTSATRLVKRLAKYGDTKARVINTPARLSGGGCSYSVTASLSSEQFIRKNIQGITVRGIYIEEFAGGERIYHDIS